MAASAITSIPTGLLTEIGVGGIFAYLILKLVLDFVNKKNGGGVRSPVDPREWSEVVRKTRDLWDWHNKEDPATGKKLWYSDSLLTQALSRLAVSTEANTKAMLAIDHNIEMMAKDIIELRKEEDRRANVRS